MSSDSSARYGNYVLSLMPTGTATLFALLESVVGLLLVLVLLLLLLLRLLSIMSESVRRGLRNLMPMVLRRLFITVESFVIRFLRSAGVLLAMLTDLNGAIPMLMWIRFECEVEMLMSCVLFMLSVLMTRVVREVMVSPAMATVLLLMLTIETVLCCP